VALPEQRVRKWFLRGVYRNADPSTYEGRGAYLDTLDDVLMRQVSAGGKRLVSASSTGSQASYEFAEGQDLSMLASLSDWARSYISEDTIEEALELVVPPVRYLSTSFARIAH
jgi:hypothetical protein